MNDELSPVLVVVPYDLYKNLIIFEKFFVYGVSHRLT
jgi:hypothetical protein